MLNLILISLFVLIILSISYFFSNEELDINQSSNSLVKCSICSTYIEISKAKKIEGKWTCVKKECNQV
ncbi:hypothetical protein OA512_03490 [SAR86 cluster bacterium]|nr:hypothetical protein [SAR86 cluster bacterium]